MNLFGKTFQTVLCAVAMTVSLSSIVNAQSSKKTLTECVQRGLLENGFDPNGVDGLIGGGTLKAASAWKTESGGNLEALSRKADLKLLRDWCFQLEPPKELYGELFQIIKRPDGSYVASDVGPALVHLQEDAKWMRVRGVHRATSWENNVTPANLRATQKRFIGDLPESLKVLGIAKRISPDFFQAFSADQVWADQTRTYVMSVSNGTYRMIVFNDNEPYHLIKAATISTWGDKLEEAIDWSELKRAYVIEMPAEE